MGLTELAENLFEEAREWVDKAGVTLLDLEVIPSRRTLLRFVIDGEGGVTIDDCVRVDRILTEFLDESDHLHGSYTIEVTSPGVQRRLRRREEYDHFRGRSVQIHADLNDRGTKELRGVLEGSDGEEVLLMTDGELTRIPLDRIVKARLLFEDRKGTTSGRGR